MSTDDGGGFDIAEVMRYLPHRYPFLLVDRILACDPKKWIRGIKNVTANEPFFQGHFPAYPVMPGVLVVEALAQVSAILYHRIVGTQASGERLIFFAGIDQARFRRQVIPGDQLILESELVRVAHSVGKFRARARVGDDIAAEATLMAAERRIGA